MDMTEEEAVRALVGGPGDKLSLELLPPCSRECMFDQRHLWPNDFTGIRRDEWCADRFGIIAWFNTITWRFAMEAKCDGPIGDPMRRVVNSWCDWNCPGGAHSCRDNGD